MRCLILIATLAALLASAAHGGGETKDRFGQRWHVDFFDDFETFNPDNWQDQILWVNEEDHCYVRDNAFNTREVSDGTLKLRVVALPSPRSCDNFDKHGKKRPDTRYVAGRIASKNRQEFVKGRWTARLSVPRRSAGAVTTTRGPASCTRAQSPDLSG